MMSLVESTGLERRDRLGNSKAIGMRTAWESFFLGSSDTSSKAIGYWSGGLIISTVGQIGLPSLFFEVDGAAASERAPELEGLILDVVELRVEAREGTYLKLELANIGFLEPFRLFTLEVLGSLETYQAGEGTLQRLLEVINEWVDFFRLRVARVSREKIIGLAGELIALRDVIDLDGVEAKIWQGPLGGIQDFIFEKDALEVKTLSTRTGPVVHKVSSLQQLEAPTGGTLYLLSLRLHFHESGQENFHNLVDHVRMQHPFKSSADSKRFEKAVNLSGYSESLPPELTHFDIKSLALFNVQGDFPRLVPSMCDLIPGVINANYEIDVTSQVPIHVPSGQKVKFI